MAVNKPSVMFAYIHRLTTGVIEKNSAMRNAKFSFLSLNPISITDISKISIDSAGTASIPGIPSKATKGTDKIG